MTTTTEALNLAIETQDAIRNFVGGHGQENTATFLLLEADRALSAVRTALAQPQPSVPSAEPAAVLLQAIQRLNQNPYSLTKSECIAVLQELRDEFGAAPLMANGPETAATASVAGLPELDPKLPDRAQGVFRKFEVRRADGSSEPGGKHYGCEHFVLDVDHDPCAKPALKAYADAVEATHSVLAADMRNRYGLERAAPQAAPVAPEPITVEAVAEVVDTADGLELRWLIEGGIAAMDEGCVLVMPHRPITDDFGHGEVYMAQSAPTAPAPAAQPPNEEAMKWRKAVQEAYGWLWHTNNEPMAPVPMWSPEQAAYQARKCLRELLTTAERGEAINAIAAHMDKIAGITAAPTKE